MGNKSHFFRQSSGGGGDAFIATFRTATDNESITLPYVSNGTYSGTIDWGDGTIVENSYANRTHIYSVAGDYDITVLGECTDFSYVRVNDTERRKIINIKNWGTGIRFYTASQFVSCSNLDITAIDVPNLDGLLTFDRFFRNCFNLVFNESINNWDTHNITDFFDTFQNAYLFNQPLNSWNTCNVRTLSLMFQNAHAFNQDISSWNFSSLNSYSSLANFMSGKSDANYNADYYDNLLIKWALDPSVGGLQPNIITTIDMGSIKYTSNGAAARQSILDNNKAQTITDGGQI